MSGESNNGTSVIAAACLAVVAGSLVWEWQGRRIRQTSKINENDKGGDHRDVDMPHLSRKGKREIQKKQRLAEQHLQDSTRNRAGNHEKRIDSLVDFVPAGNFETSRWIVTDMGVPINEFAADYSHHPDEWKLTLRYGKRIATVTAQDLFQLDSYRLYKDECHQSWHCVTGWSKHGLCFWGVSLPQVLTTFLPEAFEGTNDKAWTWLYQTSADGYTCPVARQDCMNATAILALQQQERPGELPVWLDEKHGGPRIFVPHLWGWKSAKWMMHIELIAEYRAGFWEKLVCHRQGRVYDPETMIQLEERWKSTHMGLVANLLAGLANLYHHIFGAAVYSYVLQEGGKLIGMLKNVFKL